VKRIVRFRDALIGAAGRSIDFRRALHLQRLVRTFVVELLDEPVKLGLLLQQIGVKRAA
jgi:hypothetical protein